VSKLTTRIQNLAKLMTSDMKWSENFTYDGLLDVRLEAKVKLAIVRNLVALKVEKQSKTGTEGKGDDLAAKLVVAVGNAVNQAQAARK